MAEKIVSTQITDHVDGQPAIVMSNGNWGVFDPKTNMYKDNGIKASPEDDATAIKYYKLGNTSTPPEAPTRAGGWDSLTTLNASLAQADWDEDPLTTSKTNKFCWIAFYGKENVVDVSATESAGHLIFKPKYTRTKVSLWSNYADSPTISVVGNEIIITNPDGTVVTQKFATTEAIADIANLIASLQEQMDGSVYSYSLEGEPSMTKAPVTTWINGVDPSLIADIYSQHVGDTYTDLLTYVSYRFALIQGSASDPSNYGWKVIEDSALTNALGEIARLGREKVTIFTETPTAYSKGDMWLQPDNTMKIAIASRETFSEGDWIQPYATKLEVSDIREDLTAAQTDATAAKNQIGELVLGLTTMDGAVADAIKDSIISDTEHMNLTAELKQLNVDQESLNATVAYLLASTYLPTTPKDALVAKKELLLGANGTSGSMGAYRTAISTMIADRVITAPERTAYNNAFSTYKTHLKDFNAAISNARQAIDAELKRLADEKVDNIEIGGRNLLLKSELVEGGVGADGGFTGFKDRMRSGFIKVESNGTYTLKLHEYSGDTLSIFIKEYAGDKTYTGQTVGNSKEFTFKVSPTTKHIIVYIHTFFNPDALLKLEKGNKATDWTEAPEDAEARLNEAVIKATYWSLKASTPVIYKDANSATASGVHTPVTVNGELRSGTTTTQGGFISIQPNGGAESTATASPRTIAPTNAEGKTSYTVRLYEKADKVTLLDTMTIPVVFKGASGVNAINASLSNEADVLPASPDGVVSDYTGSGTIIRVFEGATELTYGTGNGQYQVSALGSGINVGTPSTAGNTRVYGVASNMTSDNATITFTISGKTSSGTSFSLTKVQAFAKSRVGQKGNDGIEGEGGINVTINRQGSFRTYWRQIGDQGQILTAPEKVSEIIGGVEIGGIKYIQCKVIIYKGSVDVTASALADPTTQGKWYINDEPTPKGTGEILNIPVSYADGKDDEVRFEYIDTNAKNWVGQ